MTADLETYTKNKPSEFLMTIDGRTHTERTDAAEHLAVLSHRLGKEAGSSLDVGSYAGLTVSLMRSFGIHPTLVLTGTIQYHTDMGESELGNISRIENLADRIEKDKGETENELASLRQQLADSLVESKKPFVHEDRLAELQKRKVELDLELEFKDDGDDVIDGEADEADEGDMDGEQPQPSAPLTLNQQLYKKLYPIARPVLDGSAYHMKLESSGFEDLVVENIGGGEYSIAHYYKQNGNAMRDPEITFKVDEVNKSIHPTSFTQDDMGVFYETQSASLSKVRDLEQFMSQWFSNIKSQGFEPITISTYKDENEDEQEPDFER